jgi:hypothetical protein
MHCGQQAQAWLFELWIQRSAMSPSGTGLRGAPGLRLVHADTVTTVPGKQAAAMPTSFSAVGPA